MNASKQILDCLLNEYNSGMKQTEMAKKHNVSQQYICRLLSGKRSCADLTIKTLTKMFPLASLNLNGDISTSQTGTNNVVVNGENSGTVNNGAHPAVQSIPADTIRARIIAALIPLDIPPESLQTVLRTINELDLT